MGNRGKNKSDEKTRYKQLHDDLKEKRENWQLKEETIDHTVWKLALEDAMELS